MAETFRLDGRPQQRALGTVAPTTSARPGDYLGAMPKGNAELDGLVRGLSQLVPTLGAAQQRQQQVDEAAAIAQAKADAQRAEAPQDFLTKAPIVTPGYLPAALGETYRRAFSETVVGRAGAQLRSDTAVAYMQEKDTPNFSVDAFLQSRRQSALAGIKDPLMSALLGQQFQQLEAEVMSDHQRKLTQDHLQSRETAAFQLLGAGVRPDMSVPDIADYYRNKFLPQARDLGIDPKTAAQALFMRVNAASEAVGGAPQLFEVFNQDSDVKGMSILAANPQLTQHVAAAKHQATTRRDQEIHRQTEPARAALFMKLDDAVMRTPEVVTPDYVMPFVGQHGLTAEKAAAYVHAARKALEDRAGHASVIQDAYLGILGYHDVKTQKAVLDQLLGPAMLDLWKAGQSGDDAKVRSLAEAVMQRQSQFRSTVPVESLERFTKVAVTALPKPEGPDANFNAAASIYRAMSADPRYRDLYFKDDAADLMGSYVRALERGQDPQTAYAAAYYQTSPEGKEAIKKRLADPNMQSKLQGIAQSYTEGSSWWPQFLGGNGRPENAVRLGAWAAAEAQAVLSKDPDMTDSEVKAYVEEQAQKHWVMDTTSGRAVKVPPGYSGKQTQEALSSFSKAFMENAAANRVPDGFEMRFMDQGTEGAMAIQVGRNGVWKTLQSTTVADIVRAHALKTQLTDQERVQLGEYRAAMRTGGALPNLDPGLLGKARSLNYFNPVDLTTAEARMRTQMQERLAAVPKMVFKELPGSPTEVPTDRGGKVDQQLTSRLALEFAGMPVAGPNQQHIGLAASLITQREGVVLQAYQDPSKGTNIGMGYSLTANAATVDQDLRRAGVDEGQLAAVKAGKVELTPDQAKRLLVNTLPRFEKQVQAAADSTVKGLWERMPPQQKAVMVDIAWQTGDPAKFTKAWQALAANDDKAFASEVATVYTNRKGERVEDTRAGSLRASLLAGIPRWEAMVSIAGKTPSTALQSEALLNQPKK